MATSGQILSDIALPAGQSIRRNAGDTAFEAFTPSGGSAAWGAITGTLSSQSDLITALGAKAPLASPTFTGTVGGVTKAMVGLSNVDNTTDAGKPVSTAQATADGLRVLKAGDTMTGILQTTKLKLSSTTISPTADSTTAIQITKANGATSVVNVDTTSSGVGIGTTTPNSVLQVAGAISTAISTKTASYTLTATDSVIVADGTSNAVTITLPLAAGCSGREYTVKCINADNSVKLSRSGTDHIDTNTAMSLAQWSAVRVVSDGVSCWLKLTVWDYY